MRDLHGVPYFQTQKERRASMMSSPEKREAPDLQLSFVFGTSDGRPQKPPATPVDAVDCSAEMLCLSRTNLKCVGENIFKNSTLKVSLGRAALPINIYCRRFN